MKDKLRISNEHAFTLVEILVALVISSIVMAGAYNSFISQNESYITQESVVTMQQNLRSAAYYMTNDIIMAGYNPTHAVDVVSGVTVSRFRVIDVKFKDLNGNADTSGFSTITFSRDDDKDGVVDSNESIDYGLYDAPVASPDGIVDLYKDSGTGRLLLVKGIQAMGLAYAYDVNDDGILEKDGGNTIWAIDSNNDDLLDKNIDTDNDGLINTSDNAAGIALPAPTTIPLTKIRTVKIWLLAKAEKPTRGFSNTATYVVGNKRITAADSYMRRILVTTVRIRNAGL